MLKSEIMRNQKPQSKITYFEKPLKASLSPHYRRARELQKAAPGVNDNIITRTALMNAKIELNHLVQKQEKKKKNKSTTRGKE